MKWITTDYKGDKVEWYSADVIEKIKGICNNHIKGINDCGSYNPICKIFEIIESED